MICVTLAGKSYREIVSLLERNDIEMAEIRLDLCHLSEEEIEDLFANSDKPLVATSRGNDIPLRIAIEAGARFADLEIDAPAKVSREIQQLCRKRGTELIRSYHNYDFTPSDEDLQKILARAFRYGADIAKIAVAAHSREDAVRLLSLYEVVLEGVDSLEGRLVAFSIGEEFSGTRKDAVRKGAPFIYAALSAGEVIAPGQPLLEEAWTWLYGNMKPYSGKSVTVPSSKSFAQRAIIAAALAEGVSTLEDYVPCADCESAVRVAEALGAEVSVSGTTMTVRGVGASAASLNIKELNVGESGLLARLMIPLSGVLCRGNVRIDGAGTLLDRPLAGAVNIMASFGVIAGDKVPLTVKGNLIPGAADVSGKDGSQLISGLLMSLPLCSKPSSLFVGEPKSIPYMFITQDVMRKFGVNVFCEMEGDVELLEEGDWSSCTGMDFKIGAPQRYRASSLKLERDWSSAAAFLVAGAIFGYAEVEGLDPSSIQADICIVDILVDAGAVVYEDDETGLYCARKAPLEAFTADLTHCPDLFPLAAVLASFCAGESRIGGIGRLMYKESNRGEAILEMLGKMGVEAYVEGDVMVVEGESLSARLVRGHLLNGGTYSSFHDHRMAMALEVASMGSGSPIEIDDRDCVSKSFPGFSLQ